MLAAGPYIGGPFLAPLLHPNFSASSGTLYAWLSTRAPSCEVIGIPVFRNFTFQGAPHLMFIPLNVID